MNKSKQMLLYISSKRKQVFDYIGIKLEERSDFSIIITQKDYIDTINPVEFNKGDLKNPKRKFSQKEITILRKNTRKTKLGGRNDKTRDKRLCL